MEGPISQGGDEQVAGGTGEEGGTAGGHRAPCCSLKQLSVYRAMDVLWVINCLPKGIPGASSSMVRSPTLTPQN